ncbi:hypothetical protein B8A33_06285 [Dolosigranulum pigrum]|jgi:hypothetical protein|uniref:hypothetical protein n=1 Tax=Dolosigranulum pigrum TaxID=29394 RepID=UPI000DC05192|nr:hypothetical protein [Dolosigranulum pigrum]RAN56282.1 hypothetical protein B8A33_06285 [Dolosigranulum pigrum]
MKIRQWTLILVAASLLTACGNRANVAEKDTSDDQAEITEQVDQEEKSTADKSVDEEQEFPDILEAELMHESGDEYTIAVTVSSPYDTPERYADGWRVMTMDGDVLAEHDLAHDHANEQPFTRSRGPFTIPSDIQEVVVEGHDQANGYGGETVTIAVPR